MIKHVGIIFISLITALYFAFILIFLNGKFCNVSLYNILLYIFAYPVVEEYFFRGILQKKIKEKITGRIFVITYANILTSLIFVFFHLIFSFSTNSLLVFIPSIVLGYLYDRYGRIYVPVIFHGLFNINIFLCYNGSFLHNILN